MKEAQHYCEVKTCRQGQFFLWVKVFVGSTYLEARHFGEVQHFLGVKIVGGNFFCGSTILRDQNMW